MKINKHIIYIYCNIHIYIYSYTCQYACFSKLFSNSSHELFHGFPYFGLLITYLFFCFNKFVYLFILNIFLHFFIYPKLADIQPARAAFCTHPFARAAFYIHAPFCKGLLLHTLWQGFLKNSLLQGLALSQGLAPLQGLPLLAKTFCKGSLWMLTLSQGLKGPRVKGNCSPAPVSFARLPPCQSCPFARTSVHHRYIHAASSR